MNVLIFGATGTIGDKFFSLARKKSEINVVGATCNSNIKKILKLKEEFKISNIGINNEKYAKSFNTNIKNDKLFIGINEFSKMITDDVDIIIFSISGLSALKLSLDIASSRKLVGLANKECIISLGKRFLATAKKFKTKIVPLDSEHYSIYKLLNLKYSNINSVTLTASGGPFYNKNLDFIKKATPRQALKHPVWKMGKKISIDSSNLMNKALELIEAMYLFNLKPHQLDVVIHPDSIIHAALNFSDGTSGCLMYKPDMKIPISNLFNEFEKNLFINEAFKLSHLKNLSFIKINKKKFPAIDLGIKVMKIGGIAPHVFNYNNELLVNLFLKGKIKYLDIVNFNKITLNKYFYENKNVSNPSLLSLNKANKWIDSNLFLG